MYTAKVYLRRLQYQKRLFLFRRKCHQTAVAILTHPVDHQNKTSLDKQVSRCSQSKHDPVVTVPRKTNK